MKKERATTSDEQRERLLIAEQIEKAAAEARDKSESPDSSDTAVDKGLQRDESAGKVTLSLTPKMPVAPTTAESGGPGLSSGFKLNALKPVAANPLKRPNVFKMGISVKSSQEKDTEKLAGKKRDAPMSAAERLIYEEQERKRRKMEREGGRS